MMKSVKLFSVSVLALVLLAACQREEVVDNPFFNKETNEVVTSFVFNVSTQSGPQTRQSADAVQASVSSPFRGITDAKLLTYSEEASGKILPADKTADKLYDLAYVASAGTLSNSNSRRVMEMSLPLQTNTLLFYGRAPLGDPYGGFDNPYDCYGHMDVYSIGKTYGSADFQLGQRVNGDKYNKFVVVENLFAGVMSMLLNTKLPEDLVISATDGPSGVANKYKYNVTIPAGGIAWKDYDKIENSLHVNKSPYSVGVERYPLEDKLYTLYRQLTTIRAAEGELRAGSGEAILRMAQDLFTVLNEVRCAEPLNEAETVAKYLANKVYYRMLKYYTADTNNTGGPISNVAFLDQATIVENYLSAEEVDTRPSDTNDTSVWPDAAKLATIQGYDPADFPFNFDLPRGSTHIAFDAAKERFYYPQTFNVSGMGIPGSGSTYNAQSYYYPAELMYFGNSPIRTSNSDVVASAYPNGAGQGAGQWDANASWASNWNGNQVAAATRAVAMQYDINYGVALLETKVKFASGISNLKDNNHHVQDMWDDGLANDSVVEQDQNIPVSNTAFKLTGVIIGGQSQRVGWDYLPVKVGEDYKYGFVYDKAVPTAARDIPTATSNYTLVFDNFHAASETDGIYTPAASQDVVHVALEFLNNSGKDFYGNENLIRKDGYFYLIGALNPANATNKDSIEWPDNVASGFVPYFIPPYTAAGGSQHVNRVFIQDFMTTAEFVLGQDSLKAAYLTVPDLRSSSMTLGLSVNLSWETGLNFEDVVLGATQ